MASRRGYKVSRSIVEPRYTTDELQNAPIHELMAEAENLKNQLGSALFKAAKKELIQKHMDDLEAVIKQRTEGSESSEKESKEEKDSTESAEEESEEDEELNAAVFEDSIKEQTGGKGAELAEKVAVTTKRLQELKAQWEEAIKERDAAKAELKGIFGNQ